MPFGAEVLASGQIRFRLWAPAAQTVELCLSTDAGDTVLPVEAGPDGWFTLVAEPATATCDYAYRIDGQPCVPDPASRFQPGDVAGRSRVVDPRSFLWSDEAWRGRPWSEAVIYELHVGAFTPEGSFDGVLRKLDHLCDLGVTAIELMPVASFPGRWNWGYDGVLPFAPDAAYGGPGDLKRLIQSAHARGMMAFLDVVYNHFGPEGNYLHRYAPEFFTDRHRTPWGAAMNFDGPGSRVVRDFFIHNALYWLEEYRFDGLRFDAVHAIADDSEPDILTELATAVRAGPGREREIHLILENDRNESRYLERDPSGAPRLFTAQWNDDMHHAMHVLLTGETDGYYADYADRPLWYLGRCLAAGFGYQGETSRFRDGQPRGDASAHLPPPAFVDFLQTHDQVGNRAYGERLTSLARPEAVRAAAAITLLAPSIPLLFMGEEFGAIEPFLFFCDFGPELAAAVAEGRRKELALHERTGAGAPEPLPDPASRETFLRSRLDWRRAGEPVHREQLEFYRTLLALRSRELAPRLRTGAGARGQFDLQGGQTLRVRWLLGDGASWTLLANPAPRPSRVEARPAGDLVYAFPPDAAPAAAAGTMPPWSALWHIQPPGPEGVG